MERAVDNLESMFQKAEKDLDYLSKKFEFQIEYEQGASSESNPLRLMKKIEEIKAEYSTLVQDISAIQTAQKDAVDFFRTQLLAMVKVLEKLETQTGQNPELAEETIAQFEELSQLMGIPKEDLVPSSGAGVDDETTSRGSTASDPSAGTTSATGREPLPGTDSSQGNTVTEKQETAAVTSPPLSAFDRRASSTEFIDVTSEEFLSVSDLVRGRVKLDDLNRTYRLLWQHFKEEGNREALTPKEMNNMGLRVSGATGEAKLKILRALKLCQISKHGDVKLT